jgi:hypothetical protein
VTINHLDVLKTIGDSEQISVLIGRLHWRCTRRYELDTHKLWPDAALQLAFEVYGNMSSGDWFLLRQHLFTFVQGRKIKASPSRES